MVVITRNAFPEYGEYTVWREQYWATPFFAKHMGRRRYWRAKKLLLFPVWPGVWFGLFWRIGNGWIN